MTQDIDIVVELWPNQVGRFARRFPPRVLREPAGRARGGAAAGQFNVIHSASGNKIDFMIARRDAWGRSQVGRRRQEQILPGRSGYVCGARGCQYSANWHTISNRSHPGTTIFG